MPSLNSVVLVTEWGSAWVRRRQILACSSWRPGSPCRPGVRISCASLYPDPKWRFSAHACCLACRFPAYSWMAVPPALPARCTIPGTSRGLRQPGECKYHQSRDTNHRCWWWCQGKATLVCICQWVTLVLFPVIKKKLAEHSFLQYHSVDTQTLLQRCLNTNV